VSWPGKLKFSSLIASSHGCDSPGNHFLKASGNSTCSEGSDDSLFPREFSGCTASPSAEKMAIMFEQKMPPTTTGTVLIATTTLYPPHVDESRSGWPMYVEPGSSPFFGLS
jgi:hypothetical protein